MSTSFVFSQNLLLGIWSEEVGTVLKCALTLIRYLITTLAYSAKV